MTGENLHKYPVTRQKFSFDDVIMEMRADMKAAWQHGTEPTQAQTMACCPLPDPMLTNNQWGHVQFISQVMLKKSIFDKNLDINSLRVQPHLTRSDELMCQMHCVAGIGPRMALRK